MLTHFIINQCNGGYIRPEPKVTHGLWLDLKSKKTKFKLVSMILNSILEQSKLFFFHCLSGTDAGLSMMNKFKTSKYCACDEFGS